MRSAKGTSKFLMMQGAAPSKCIMSGPGVTCALAGHSAFFWLQARDTYGNLTSNGGEKFEVRVSRPDSLTEKQKAEIEPDAQPEILDRGDGSYEAKYTVSESGDYALHVVC